LADQKPHKKSPVVEMELSVVGLGYRMTPATMAKIAADCPLQARLVREPKNAHDENAVAVWLQEKPYNFHIGYLPRAVAAAIAPKLDSGEVEIVEAWVSSVDVIHTSGEIVVKARKMKSLQKREI
jgi:hypothetical protein